MVVYLSISNVFASVLFSSHVPIHLLWFVIHGSKCLLDSLLTNLAVVPATHNCQIFRQRQRN